MNAATRPTSEPALRSRARFYGAIPESYEALNREFLQVASLPSPEPAALDRIGFRAAATTADLDRVVKVVPLATPIPADLSKSAILGMERLRNLGVLTALRGDRLTDLPRPSGGRFSADVRSHASAVVELIERIESEISGCHLFVRAIKLDQPRASTTATSNDPNAENLHFDAERSCLADYSEPVFQFYLNAGTLQRQFRILPVLREDLLAVFEPSERQELPLAKLLTGYLEHRAPIFETLPVKSGSLAIFDGRHFAHDAGKAALDALAAGRFEPSSEPDLVIALDTLETGYHQGLYRPELPFFEDTGFPESHKT